MRNVEIRVELKQVGVLEKVTRSQVRSRKALEEMGSEGLVKRVHETEMQGRRERGKNKMITLTLS